MRAQKRDLLHLRAGEVRNRLADRFLGLWRCHRLLLIWLLCFGFLPDIWRRGFELVLNVFLDFRTFFICRSALVRDIHLRRPRLLVRLAEGPCGRKAVLDLFILKQNYFRLVQVLDFDLICHLLHRHFFLLEVLVIWVINAGDALYNHVLILVYLLAIFV